MTPPVIPVATRPVRVTLPGVALDGDLTIPSDATGLVLFAHGSGSSRHSSRNRAVAEVLQQAQLATLLLDLLTANEEQADIATAEFRFDISMLGSRVIRAVDWARAQPATASLPIGLFGASTGAAAALIAAAERPAVVHAVVSRGGRPDLANHALESVTSPTLLIVGGRDDVVIDLNQHALDRLGGPKELKVVSGASHLFEEPGTLDEVATLARDWFGRYLRRVRP